MVAAANKADGGKRHMQAASKLYERAVGRLPEYVGNVWIGGSHDECQHESVTTPSLAFDTSDVALVPITPKRATFMIANRCLHGLTLMAFTLGGSGWVLAQTPSTNRPPATATSAPPPPSSTVKVDMVPSLIVMNARGAALQGGSLVLSGVSQNAIVFADRPVRSAGHLLTAHVLEEWTVGSFTNDPPNATVSVLSRDGASVRDAVVELKRPQLDGDRLTFEVRLLEGDLGGADGPASVFIDIIGLPFTPLSVAGVARRTARRAYWYGAATAPYYRPYAYPPLPPPAYGYPYPGAYPPPY
jgi:hypothetical protein